MDGHFEYVKDLFEEFAEMIEGETLISEYPSFIKLIKDDILLEYRFATRDQPECFIYAVSLPMDNIRFIIKNKKRLNLSVDLERVSFVDDYFVLAPERGNTEKLLESLFRDFEFKECLDKYLWKWQIYYHYNTLVIFLNKRANPLMGHKITVEDLNHAYLLLLETKKALEFHYKRI